MTRPPPPGERVLCDQAGRDRSGGGFNCTLIKIIFYIEFRAAYDFLYRVSRCLSAATGNLRSLSLHLNCQRDP